jgi:predicted PurR-regulated permease PerM
MSLVIVLLLLGLWTLRGFLPALAWAAIFGIALWPLYRRAESRWGGGKHNVLMPALFTLAIGLIFVAPLVLIVIEVAREAHSLLQWFHEAQATGVPVPEWVAHLPVGSEPVAVWWRENLERPQGASDLLKQFEHGSIVPLTREFGTQLVHRVVLFAFMLMSLFFVFRDGRALRHEMLVASHKLFGPRGEKVARHMVLSVHGTVNGLVLVGLGEGALLGVSYWLAGAPHPVLLGALTAVAAMIPFGAPLVFGIAALLLVSQGAVGAAIGVFAFGMAVLAVADHVVRPILIGGATRLPFVWVLFGILGGVETWGLLGLFLGPALMAALMLLWRELTDQEEIATVEGGRSEPAAQDEPRDAVPGRMTASSRV